MLEERAVEYRAKAQECRDEVARTSDESERKKWLTMADEWEALARSVEETSALGQHGALTDHDSN